MVTLGPTFPLGLGTLFERDSVLHAWHISRQFCYMAQKNSFTYSEQFFVPFYARLTYAFAFPTTHPLHIRALCALVWLRKAMHGARHKLYEAGRNVVAAVVGNLADERAKTGKGPDNSAKVWNKLCFPSRLLAHERRSCPLYS